ncbi:MAG: PAS domain S-box protein [Ginsengibacter sp.]
MQQIDKKFTPKSNNFIPDAVLGASPGELEADIIGRDNVNKPLEEKESSILKERQLLHNFFMKTPALLAILKGPHHIFELANPQYSEFIGNRNVVGKKILDIMPELSSQGFVEILDNVYNTGESFTGSEMPVTIAAEKGKSHQRFVNLNCQVFKDAGGNIEGILVFAYDVTPQVKSRRQLEQNAEMLQNVYMNARAFVCTFMGPQHTYTLVNPAYQKLFGKRELVGKPIMVALPELEGQGFDKILDNVYNTGEVFVASETLVWLARDEGLAPEERYFNFSYQPIYNEEKKITGIVVFGYEVTEQVVGRKIQKEIAARFQGLADAMPQKVSTRDQAGIINYLNRQWLDYTGITFKEIKEWSWKKVIHPADLNLYQQAWEHSINTGEDFQLEQRILRYDGVYRWHLSWTVAQRDEQGKIKEWIGTHTDIEERKQSEEKVRIAEEFNRNVLQSSPDCVKVLDGEGRIIFINSNGLCQLDIENLDVLKNKPWLELWGEENKTVIESAITKGLKGETVQFQALAPTFKGVLKWWDVLVSPVTSSNGIVTQLISVSRDITEQKNLEIAIIDSEKHFRQMANTMPQKVWTADKKGKLNYFNQQWLVYTHKSLEELEGQGWQDVIHPDDWVLNQKTWQHSIDTGEDFQLEHRFLRYDGMYRWHLSRGIAQRNEKNEIMGWIGTHTDIDEQKILEQAKDEFIAIASHELKTPLTTAKAYIQLLEMDMKETNNEALIYAQKAGVAIERLNDLIRELLDVSQIQNGELDLNITSFNFNSLVRDAVESIQCISFDHQIILTGEINDPVTGDKKGLQQVIVNLLNNAVKYSPESRNVYINIEEEKGLVKVSVKDLGIGIRKQSLEKIFERYYREEQRSLRFQGLGIGLFISFEIIRRHLGKIWAESEVGQGSTFYFTIPLS